MCSEGGEYMERKDVTNLKKGNLGDRCGWGWGETKELEMTEQKNDVTFWELIGRAQLWGR